MFAVVGATVGSYVWWRRPQSRLNSDEYIQVRIILIIKFLVRYRYQVPTYPTTVFENCSRLKTQPYEPKFSLHEITYTKTVKKLKTFLNIGKATLLGTGWYQFCSTLVYSRHSLQVIRYLVIR